MYHFHQQFLQFQRGNIGEKRKCDLGEEIAKREGREGREGGK